MPHRPLAVRVAAAAIAVWLGVVLADAPALDRCPMGDGSGAASAGMAMPGMAGMPGMMGTAAGATAAAPGHLTRGGSPVTPPAPGRLTGGDGSPASPPSDAKGCCCLGACTVGAVALVAPATPAVVAAAPRAAPAPVPLPAVPARGTTAHFLPFAQAPPLLA